MEKAGSMLHSPKIEQKGHAKREAAGHYFAGASIGNGHDEQQQLGGPVGDAGETYSPATGDRVRTKAGGGHGADHHEGMHGAVGSGAGGAAAARDVSPMDTSAAAADQLPGDQYGSSERTGYGRDTSYETGRDNY